MQTDKMDLFRHGNAELWEKLFLRINLMICDGGREEERERGKR